MCSGSRGPCTPQGNVAIHLSPAVPSSLPAQGQGSRDSPLLHSPVSSISPLCWVSPNTIRLLLFFPSDEENLFYTMLFSASLFLLPSIAELLETVTFLSPLPFLECLLNPPHCLLPPSLHPTVLVKVTNDLLTAKLSGLFLVLFVLVLSAAFDPSHPSSLNLFSWLPGPLVFWLSYISLVAPSLPLLLVPPHQPDLSSTQS